MDEVLGRAMAPVLRDLRTSGLAEPRVEESDWVGSPGSASALLRSPDGGGTGVQVSLAASAPEQVASLADQVQEWAIEELWSRGPTNWPPCPRHPQSHPMAARVQEAVAVWVCPAGEVAVAVIGGL